MRVTTLSILLPCLLLLPACGRRHRDGPDVVVVHHHDSNQGGRADERAEQHPGRGDERGPGFARPAERQAERRDDVRDAAVESRTGWDKLGECSVHGKGDRDKIHVGLRDGTFSRMMIVVEHSALELWDVEVQFGDGKKWSPGTRLVFGQNSRSRVIDLPGGQRVIKKVEFRYGNLPGGGRAQVELWAR